MAYHFIIESHKTPYSYIIKPITDARSKSKGLAKKTN
jgi:hypothetical protein